MNSREKFYEKQWFMWIMLVLFAPVGIFLMWKYNRFSKLPRIAISAVFAIFFLVMAFPNQSSGTTNNQTKSQTQVSDQNTTNKNVAASLDAKLTALGATTSLTLDKIDEVKALRIEYNNLTDDQKSYVTKLDVLTVAENTINDLQLAAEQAAAEQAAAEQAAAEQAAAEQAAAEQAAAEQAAAEQAAAQATRSSSTTQNKNNSITVYWLSTSGSYSYHKDPNCQYIRGKVVNSGSIQDASNSGHSDPCNRCAD